MCECVCVGVREFYPLLILLTHSFSIQRDDLINMFITEKHHKHTFCAKHTDMKSKVAL